MRSSNSPRPTIEALLRSYTQIKKENTSNEVTTFFEKLKELNDPETSKYSSSNQDKKVGALYETVYKLLIELNRLSENQKYEALRKDIILALTDLAQAKQEMLFRVKGKSRRLQTRWYNAMRDCQLLISFSPPNQQQKQLTQIINNYLQKLNEGPNLEVITHKKIQESLFTIYRQGWHLVDKLHNNLKKAKLLSKKENNILSKLMSYYQKFSEILSEEIKNPENHYRKSKKKIIRLIFDEYLEIEKKLSEKPQEYLAMIQKIFQQTLNAILLDENNQNNYKNITIKQYKFLIQQFKLTKKQKQRQKKTAIGELLNKINSLTSNKKRKLNNNIVDILKKLPPTLVSKKSPLKALYQALDQLLSLNQGNNVNLELSNLIIKTVLKISDKSLRNQLILARDNIDFCNILFNSFEKKENSPRKDRLEQSVKILNNIVRNKGVSEEIPKHFGLIANQIKLDLDNSKKYPERRAEYMGNIIQWCYIGLHLGIHFPNVLRNLKILFREAIKIISNKNIDEILPEKLPLEYFLEKGRIILMKKGLLCGYSSNNPAMNVGLRIAIDDVLKRLCDRNLLKTTSIYPYYIFQYKIFAAMNTQTESVPLDVFNAISEIEQLNKPSTPRRRKTPRKSNRALLKLLKITPSHEHICTARFEWLQNLQEQQWKIFSPISKLRNNSLAWSFLHEILPHFFKLDDKKVDAIKHIVTVIYNEYKTAEKKLRRLPKRKSFRESVKKIKNRLSIKRSASTLFENNEIPNAEHAINKEYAEALKQVLFNLPILDKETPAWKPNLEGIFFYKEDKNAWYCTPPPKEERGSNHIYDNLNIKTESITPLNEEGYAEFESNNKKLLQMLEGHGETLFREQRKVMKKHKPEYEEQLASINKKLTRLTKNHIELENKLMQPAGTKNNHEDTKIQLEQVMKKINDSLVNLRKTTQYLNDILRFKRSGKGLPPKEETALFNLNNQPPSSATDSSPHSKASNYDEELEKITLFTRESSEESPRKLDAQTSSTNSVSSFSN